MSKDFTAAIARGEARRMARTALAALTSGAFEEAEHLAAAVVEAEPEQAIAWLVLAAARAKQKKFSQAVPAYEAALKIDPYNIEAFCDLGECYIALADYPQAAKVLGRCLEMDPDAEHPSGRRARAVIGRTIALLRKR